MPITYTKTASLATVTGPSSSREALISAERDCKTSVAELSGMPESADPQRKRAREETVQDSPTVRGLERGDEPF